MTQICNSKSRFSMNIKYALIFLPMIMCVSAQAENWIFVGNGLYADKNSNERNGDIATIIIRHESRMDSTNRLTFDCNRQIVTHYPLKEPRTYDPDSSMGRVAALACRKMWEIWK